MSFPFRLFPLLAAGGLLSGCVLDRLWETHRQFYAKDPQVLIKDKPGEAMRIVFLKPTLLAKDIDWLVGQPPTRARYRGEEYFAEYVLVQDERERNNRQTPLMARLRYARVREDYRLAEASLPQIANVLVTPEMISAAIETMRYPAPELVRRRLRIDLKRFQDLQLPGRREIEAVIGAPNDADGLTAEYRFRLLPPANYQVSKDRTIEVAVRYDSRGRVQQAEGRYLRYRGRVDMEAGEAVLYVR